MSKSKTERKKKRKREKSSRSLLASEDRGLDNTEVQVEGIHERIKIDENCIEKKKKKKKRRKKMLAKDRKLWENETQQLIQSILQRQ